MFKYFNFLILQLSRFKYATAWTCQKYNIYITLHNCVKFRFDRKLEGQAFRQEQEIYRISV